MIKYSSQDDVSLLQIEIETGRKHQIRRHLADAGYPIVGDRLHGSGAVESEAAEGASQALVEEELDARDLQLIASYLSFTDPNSGELKTYSLPDTLIPATMS